MGLRKKMEIAKNFGIPPNTLSTFLKNKDKILNSENESGIKSTKQPSCILKWFKQVGDKKVPVSWPSFKRKGCKIIL